MKRKIFFVVICFFSVTVFSQCTPNNLVTGIGIPGVYPIGNTTIPGIPPSIPIGINNGQVLNTYSEDLTLVVLQDTTLDIAFLLPSAVVSAMNTAGLSTTMTVDVNYVTYSVIDLPNNLMYSCNISNCEYLSGNDGCINISGVPMQAGIFPFIVHMIVNIQIPPIIDPVFGQTLFSGMGVDLPEFPAQSYDLMINEVSSTINLTEKIFAFPNPTSEKSIISLKYPANIIVYNVLGESVFQRNNAVGDIIFEKNKIGEGLFYVTVNSSSSLEIIKLIIK